MQAGPSDMVYQILSDRQQNIGKRVMPTHTLECIFSVLYICHSLMISNKPGTKIRWHTCSNCYILTQIMHTDSAGCWIWPINQCFKQEIKVVHRSKPVQCYSLDGTTGHEWNCYRSELALRIQIGVPWCFFKAIIVQSFLGREPLDMIYKLLCLT